MVLGTRGRRDAEKEESKEFSDSGQKGNKGGSRTTRALTLNSLGGSMISFLRRRQEEGVCGKIISVWTVCASGPARCGQTALSCISSSSQNTEVQRE